MAPPRKKTKTTHDDKQSVLLSDFRTAWLVKKDDQAVEIRAKDEVFVVHRSVLTKHSQYFEACLKRQYAEGDGLIQFDDIDPKYLGFFIGVSYSYSSIVPHAPPIPCEYPEAMPPKTQLRDFVEVFKLCDRFVCDDIGKFIQRCLKTSLSNGHRALFRASADEGQQGILMRDFADAFEALNQNHPVEKELSDLLLTHFCGGISYDAWDKLVDKIMDRPRFVVEVSRGFARRLNDLDAKIARRLKRKEMAD